MKFIDDRSCHPLSCWDISQDMRFWIREFLLEKEASKLASNTQKSYDEALKTFLSFVDKYSKENTIENIGAKFINRYLIEYQAILARERLSTAKNLDTDEIKELQKISSQENKKVFGKNNSIFAIYPQFENTLGHRLMVIKMLLSYVSDNNNEEHDFTVMFKKLATIRKTEKFTEYLTLDEIDIIVDFMMRWTTVYKKYKPKGSLRVAHKESLLLIIYALTGARSSEVVKIKLSDVTEFTHKRKKFYRIRIQEGKGGKIREIGISADFIKDHIEFLTSELPDSSFYLSSSFKNGQYINKSMHPDTIRKFGNYILKILDINKTGLHIFRRGYATKRVVEDGANIAVVAKELGNSVAVLEKFYLKHQAEMIS